MRFLQSPCRPQRVLPVSPESSPRQKIKIKISSPGILGIRGKTTISTRFPIFSRIGSTRPETRNTSFSNTSMQQTAGGRGGTTLEGRLEGRYDTVECSPFHPFQKEEEEWSTIIGKLHSPGRGNSAFGFLVTHRQLYTPHTQTQVRDPLFAERATPHTCVCVNVCEYVCVCVCVNVCVNVTNPTRPYIPRVECYF
jgi:hypothetical protein